MTDLHPLPPIWFEILVTLSRGELHGYAIIQDVEDRTGGAVKLLPGTLYRALDRLLDESLIEESNRRRAEDDERRRYYRLTSSGRRALEAELSRARAALRAVGTRTNR